MLEEVRKRIGEIISVAPWTLMTVSCKTKRLHMKKQMKHVSFVRKQGKEWKKTEKTRCVKHWRHTGLWLNWQFMVSSFERHWTLSKTIVVKRCCKWTGSPFDELELDFSGENHRMAHPVQKRSSSLKVNSSFHPFYFKLNRQQKIASRIQEREWSVKFWRQTPSWLLLNSAVILFFFCLVDYYMRGKSSDSIEQGVNSEHWEGKRWAGVWKQIQHWLPWILIVYREWINNESKPVN